MTALILDRDGVINKDLGRYIETIEEFEFIPGVVDSLSQLSDNGFKLFVASNQAGVGKGIVTKEFVKQIEDKIQENLSQKGGRIEKFYYCFHSDSDNCLCRKPKPGLLYDIKSDYPEIRFQDTYFIGDSERDVIAAEEVGCKTIVVLTGKSDATHVAKWSHQPDFIFHNIENSRETICDKK